MAHKGIDGVVKVGSDAVGSVRSFSVDYQSETADTTKMGDAARTFTNTLKVWTASVDSIELVAAMAGFATPECRDSYRAGTNQIR